MIKTTSDLAMTVENTGIATMIQLKKQKLDNQTSMIAELNHIVLTGRRNVCIVTLASRVDSDVTETKNCFDVAKAYEPKPKADDPMWQSCCEAAAHLKELKKKNKLTKKRRKID